MDYSTGRRQTCGLGHKNTKPAATSGNYLVKLRRDFCLFAAGAGSMPILSPDRLILWSCQSNKRARFGGTMAVQLNIRNLNAEDIQTAIDWAANEGWNPGHEDGLAFLEADRSGFFAGEIDGELVTVISGVRYGDGFGFIGLFITHPDHRAKGHGQLVWDHAMTYLDGRTIGLDAVKEQTPRYAKHGFKPVYRNVRYAGISACDTPMDSRLTPLGQGLFPSVPGLRPEVFPG
jgi:ribosomal protein S18 acetylase RimI-like enzyme